MSDVVGGKSVDRGLGHFGGEKARDEAREPGTAVEPSPESQGAGPPQDNSDAAAADSTHDPSARKGEDPAKGRKETPDFDGPTASDPDTIKHDGP